VLVCVLGVVASIRGGFFDRKGKSAWLRACEYISIPCESHGEGVGGNEGNLRLPFLKMFAM
jgi:hypothetical protein